MALILCSKHGEADVSFVSPKLSKLMLAGCFSAEPIRTLQLEIDAGLRSRHFVDAIFASDVAGRFGLDGDPLVVPVGEPSFEALCDLVPVCSPCMKEWLQGNPMT